MSDLDRFVMAQRNTYQTALEEIKKGQKQSHWMWFVFPQLVGIGQSAASQFYGIKGVDEAKAYAGHPVLGARLREISEEIICVDEMDIEHILAYPDNLKLQSCMTLFYLATGEELFQKVLDKYYGGEPCEFTVQEYQKKDAVKKGKENVSA